MRFSKYLLWDHVLRESLAPELEALRNRKVLELGCGQGILARTLASLGVEVTGLDITWAADWKDRSADPRPTFVVGRGEQLPFRDNAFDAVVSCGTFQYQDCHSTLTELMRVTRDGGVLFLHENMPHNPIVLLYRCMRRVQAKWNPGVARYISTIKGYVSPHRLRHSYRLQESRFLSCQVSYLFAPLIFSLPRPLQNAAISRLVMSMDKGVLRTLPFLRRFSWLCAYHIEVSKNSAPTRADFPTIGSQFLRFFSSKSPKDLLLALAATIRQGRTLELMYGFYCYIVCRPSAVIDTGVSQDIVSACLELVKKSAVESDGLNLRLEKIGGLPKGFPSRSELVVQTQRGHIVGEYANRSARLFYIVGKSVRQFDYYNRIPGVRHLHSIACDNERTLLVTTGDSAKYLDEWTILGDTLVFKRRLMSCLAGFTAHVKVRNAIYFGTDFSERPNYILRFHDRKKFFLPDPSYRQFINSMLPFMDRYIVCSCCSLNDRSSITIFDVDAECFIYAKDTG